MSKNMTRPLLIIAILCLSALTLSAQEKIWRLTFVSHDTLTASRLDSLSDSTLFVSCNGKVVSFPIDSIGMLVGYKEGKFGEGAGFGFLIGMAAGAIIGAASYNPNTLNPGAYGGAILGSIGGIFIGGMITGTDTYETYDLRSHKDVKMKRRILQLAINNDRTT